MRFLRGLILSFLWAGLALAQERITSFDVDIVVENSGDIIITETIDIISTGDQIKRGIFRELPARFTFMGVRQDYQYDLLSVQRDEASETVAASRNGNAIVWRIGRGDVLLTPGPHRYTIRYRVAQAIRNHGDGDELYWNVTGTFWDFPIEQARATIRFPDGAVIIDTSAYTGTRRSNASDATARVQSATAVFKTIKGLPRNAGLTVSATVAPGLLAPMSVERKQGLFWIQFGALFMLGGGGLGLLAYYWRQWSRVGRDPQKQPVFARYEPPKGYSPAAVHYIHYKRFKGTDALSAMLMQLGAQGALDIKADKNATTIRQRSTPIESGDGQALVSLLLARRGGELVLDGRADSGFHAALGKFYQRIAKTYGPKYFRYNIGWVLLGFLASLALAVAVILSPVSKNGLLVLALFIGLAALNLLFAFLLPAPTRYGAQISAEIDGYKLYLETAEEKRINTADPLGSRPPAMTVDLYERFLPYAMALGVEKPWTKQFETSMPTEAANYRPTYARGNAFRAGRGPIDFSKTISKTLTAGVAASSPVSQSNSSGGFSSGRSGGGFSGGGGGGGGGGGW